MRQEKSCALKPFELNKSEGREEYQAGKVNELEGTPCGYGQRRKCFNKEGGYWSLEWSGKLTGNEEPGKVDILD